MKKQTGGSSSPPGRTLKEINTSKGRKATVHDWQEKLWRSQWIERWEMLPPFWIASTSTKCCTSCMSVLGCSFSSTSVPSKVGARARRDPPDAASMYTDVCTVGVKSECRSEGAAGGLKAKSTGWILREGAGFRWKSTSGCWIKQIYGRQNHNGEPPCTPMLHKVACDSEIFYRLTHFSSFLSSRWETAGYDSAWHTLWKCGENML